MKLQFPVALAVFLVLIIGLSAIPARAVTLLAQTHSSATTDISGLVGFWSFDENSGNTAHDAASGTDGQIMNGTWVNGKSGSAIHLGGNDAYVLLPNTNALQLTTEMTLAAWVNPEVLCAGNNPIIQKNNSYGLKILEGGQTIGFIWSGFEPHRSTTSLTTSQWYYLTATFNNGVHRIYVNGVLENQATDWLAAIPSSTGPVYIGKGDFGCNFTGMIDEIRIYQRALTSEEIQSIYEAFVAPGTPNTLRIQSTARNSVALTWTDTATNEEGYRVYRATNPAEQAQLLTTLDANSTTVTDTTVECGRDYFYEVSAYNANGESARTPRVKATPVGCLSPAVMPNAPNNLAVQNTTQNNIVLTWTDTVTNEDSFILYRSLGLTEDATLRAALPQGTTTFIDTSVECGRDYFYEVNASNTYGESAHTPRIKGTTLACVQIANFYMPLVQYEVSVAQLLTPFDANVTDVVGPSDWATNYGKSPEIIVASDGKALDVLAQDYDPKTPQQMVLLHIEKQSEGVYSIRQALTNLPMLDRVMGLAIDAAGNRYYATGVDESAKVNSSYPPLNTYRTNIVRLIKLNWAGQVQYNIDVDIARNDANLSPEMIINPMTFSSARLAVAGNEVALVHGINTAPDWNIKGTRHQKALSTRFDATTGAVTRVSSAWVSHSFDQRLLIDGEEIIESHLADAYPRFLVFDRKHQAYPLFHIKGALGENNTYTRQGNLALIENDPTYRYLALFATETTADTSKVMNGPRNLAVVRVKADDSSIDPTLPDTLSVTSSGQSQMNRLRWLTQYSPASKMHAERPKIVSVGNNQYVVLWEAWSSEENIADTFHGVYGMVIDDKGNVIRQVKLLTDNYHLQRGDDAFLLDSRAAWMTGDSAGKKLYIHFVDMLLNYEMVTIE